MLYHGVPFHSETCLTVLREMYHIPLSWLTLHMAAHSSTMWFVEPGSPRPHSEPDRPLGLREKQSRVYLIKSHIMSPLKFLLNITLSTNNITDMTQLTLTADTTHYAGIKRITYWWQRWKRSGLLTPRRSWHGKCRGRSLRFSDAPALTHWQT